LHGDDQLIMSHRPDGVWEFGLYRAAWALDVNQTYYLWYNIDAPADGAGVIKRPVEAVEPTRIFFEVSAEEDIIARMEGGRTLNLQLRGVATEPQSFSYGLDQIGPAFAATRECIRRNVEAAQAAQVAAAPEPSAPPAEETAPPKTLPAIGAARIEEFEVPGWEGAAFTDAAGAFTHCAVEAEFQNGTTVALLRTAPGPLLMTLRRLDWSLQPGEWTALEYQFTEAEPTKMTADALALDAFVLAFDIGAEAQAAAKIRDTTEIVVTAQGQRLTFDISDLGPGLAAIDDCAERHRKDAAPALEPGPGPVAPDVQALPEPSPDQAQLGR
jgi:hypothetical protein